MGEVDELAKTIYVRLATAHSRSLIDIENESSLRDDAEYAYKAARYFFDEFNAQQDKR